MWYNFAVDPVTKRQIVVFSCTTSSGFSKNGFALAKYYHGWKHYQGNNFWSFFVEKTTTFVFDTQEEAQLACTQHLNFLKECGYVI